MVQWHVVIAYEKPFELLLRHNAQQKNIQFFFLRHLFDMLLNIGVSLRHTQLVFSIIFAFSSCFCCVDIGSNSVYSYLTQYPTQQKLYWTPEGEAEGYLRYIPISAIYISCSLEFNVLLASFCEFCASVSPTWWISYSTLPLFYIWWMMSTKQTNNQQINGGNCWLQFMMIQCYTKLIRIFRFNCVFCPNYSMNLIAFFLRP